MMVPVAISVAVATGGNPSAYALIVAVSFAVIVGNRGKEEGANV